MNRLLFYSFLAWLLFATSCSGRKQHTGSGNKPYKIPAIAILPFEGCDKQLVAALKKNLEQKYTASFGILAEIPIPSSAFYPPRRRYIADSLLDFLKQQGSGRYEKIIGITIHDISTKKESHANWGIMGFGFCPGKSCVISSFRVKPTARDRDHFIKRMTILAMHELGHTLSLPHCSNTPCVMKDAEGKMNLDDADSYCMMCSIRLVQQGILKGD